MKKEQIIFWVSTGIIFLFEGVMPALTGNSDMAKQSIQHLGYPDYFRVVLNGFKIMGALVLILPMISDRVKEWAYAGFAISLISAFFSHWAVDGLNGMTCFPLIILAVLITSYIYYHKLKSINN